MTKSPLLFLDDNQSVLKEVGGYLAVDFLVKGVTTVEEAWKELQGPTLYHVVVADMDLKEVKEINEPNEAGLELVRRLKALEVRPEVVIFTGHPTVDNANRCMQAEAFAYVVKSQGEYLDQLSSMCAEADRRWHQTYLPAEVASEPEAIVVIDLVGSTASAARDGWASVGRPRFRALRRIVVHTTPRYGLCCQKSTGDGYLLAFRNDEAADLAAVQAVRAVADVAREVRAHNQTVAKHLRMELRFAVHYGEVDVIKGDREGLTVAYTFRLEGAKDSPEALRAVDPFPRSDYVVLSDTVVEILKSHNCAFPWESVSGVSLRGFYSAHRLHILRNLSEMTTTPSP